MFSCLWASRKEQYLWSGAPERFPVQLASLTQGTPPTPQASLSGDEPGAETQVWKDSIHCGWVHLLLCGLPADSCKHTHTHTPLCHMSPSTASFHPVHPPWCHLPLFPAPYSPVSGSSLQGCPPCSLTRQGGGAARISSLGVEPPQRTTS